jgi:hypothetical protein
MRSETVSVGCYRLPIGLFEPFSVLSHLRSSSWARVRDRELNNGLSWSAATATPELDAVMATH